MAITKYEKDSQIFWKVYLNLRHPENSTLRAQRMVRGIESEKLAEVLEKKLLRELSSELAKKASQGITWEELLSRWELGVRRERTTEEKQNQTYAKTTITDYASVAMKWTSDWLKKPASGITKADGRAVLEAMKSSAKTKGYIKYTQGVIARIFDWGAEHRLIPGNLDNPIRGIRIEYREEEKAPEILTIDEMKRLLRDAQALHHDWYPVWAMALLTGMRNGELYALLWSDIDFENLRITVSKSYQTRGRYVKSTKSGKWRTVPISSELLALLTELKVHSENRENVLPRLETWGRGGQAKVLRTFCKGIGIKSVRFHALRACFATQLLAHDIAPARVMKVCGWQDMKTMQHYVRLAGVDERGATEALKILPSDAACMGEVVKILDFKASN
jgi:integrase